MRKILMFAVVVGITVLELRPSQAQQLLERYQALLSERDHFSSSGQRLTTAAAIIRQDRANFHRFGIRDPEDETDKFFADADNRAALERLLAGGTSEQGTVLQIVNGTPLVRVEVWRGNAGPYVNVTVISRPAGEPAVGAETRVCRGIVMANWTDAAADYTPPDNTRLIMPIDPENSTVNSACLFDINSEAGRKIMSVCQMGFPCKAAVKLSDDPADVFIIGQVLSVENISKARR
jgi:hypothetical protein